MGPPCCERIARLKGRTADRENAINLYPGDNGPRCSLRGGSMELTDRLELRFGIVTIRAGGTEVSSADGLEVVIDDLVGFDVHGREEQERNHPRTVASTHAMEQHSPERSRHDRRQRGDRALRHGFEVREKIECRADATVVPIVLPEPGVLETVKVHLERVDPVRTRRCVALAFFRLTKVDDCSDAGAADLLPARCGDRIHILGAIERSSRRLRAIVSPESSEDTGIHQAIHLKRPTSRGCGISHGSSPSFAVIGRYQSNRAIEHAIEVWIRLTGTTRILSSPSIGNAFVTAIRSGPDAHHGSHLMATAIDKVTLS